MSNVQAQKEIGYCPQFDGLNSHLTVKESLRMIGHLRGVPDADIPDMITKLIEGLLLTDHINKTVHTLRYIYISKRGRERGGGVLVAVVIQVIPQEQTNIIDNVATF